MSVFFIKGDLFNYPGLYSYGHGCNCRGAMGKGIAVEFKRRFPKMYEEYKRRCENGAFDLGDIFVYNLPPYNIFNLGTQRSWTTKAELPAIKLSLIKMLEYAEVNSINKIGLPRIGAGLGGLIWEDVKATIIELCQASEVEIIVFEEFSP